MGLFDPVIPCHVARVSCDAINIAVDSKSERGIRTELGEGWMRRIDHHGNGETKAFTPWTRKRDSNKLIVIAAQKYFFIKFICAWIHMGKPRSPLVPLSSWFQILKGQNWGWSRHTTPDPHRRSRWLDGFWALLFDLWILHCPQSLVVWPWRRKCKEGQSELRPSFLRQDENDRSLALLLLLYKYNKCIRLLQSCLLKLFVWHLLGDAG